MTYFHDIYLKRLNRYGTNYKDRTQNKREEEFEYLLQKRSAYRVDLELEGNLFPALFEKRKQDETETTYYLLTRIDMEIPNGTILWIPNRVNDLRPWMVWYLEDMQMSGYNRYIMLKMTHQVWWILPDGSRYDTLAYMYGQQDNMLKAEIKSRSRMDTVYAEDLKLSFLVCPRSEYIKKESLVFVGQDPFFEQYKITGYDNQSSLGVSYVSVDPTYEHDISAVPQKTEADKEEDFFWLTGGDAE